VPHPVLWPALNGRDFRRIDVLEADVAVAR